MKSLKGYVGRYIVLSLRQTVQLNFGYIIRLYNDGIPYCGGIKTWDFTAICQRNSLLPVITLHVQGRVHRVPLQNQRRNQDSTWDHHSLYQSPLEATCYLSCEEKRNGKKMLQSIISTSVNLERELSSRSGMVAVEWMVYEEVEASRMAGYF